ncbi:hypothetical protein niasHT_016329 [Heterodera trifolii]|uniref:Uncharacterized protein n=1 Tax=Heterodera trifolii TaxID=157864 RepID=A0ABD2KZ00_9BILA
MQNYVRWFSKKLPCACGSSWKSRYYDRRSAQAHNATKPNIGTTAQSQKQPVPLQCADPFEPNHRRYRTCCCHSKSFTITFGVIELFIICFILVAVAPDFNTKICVGPIEGKAQDEEGQQQQEHQHIEAVQQQQHEPKPMDNLTAMVVEEKANTDLPSTITPNNGSNGIQIKPNIARKRRQLIMNEVAQQQQQLDQLTISPTSSVVGIDRPEIKLSANEKGSENNCLLLLHNAMCSLRMLWLGWAFLQMVAILLLFYGIRRQRWQLLIPHIAAIFCAFAVWLVIICLIGAFSKPGALSLAGHLILIAFLFGLFLWISLLVKAELRCAEFVKRSAETGFSICRTRPIGPPTVSQSDERERRAGSANPRAKSPVQMRYQSSLNVNQREVPQAPSNQSAVNEMSHTPPSTAQSRTADDRREEQTMELKNSQSKGIGQNNGAEECQKEEETEFGQESNGQLNLALRRGNPIGGLPPLRHTFRA